MNRKYFYIVVLFVVCSECFSQQQPQFTQYMYNTIAINPAYAGSRGVLSVVGINRNQWVGIDDAPETQTLSANTPLRNDHVGVGLSFMKDQIGYEGFTSVYGDFSYTVNVSDKRKLSLGLKAGATYYKVDEQLQNEDDPYFSEGINRWNPNVGAGALLHSDKWYVGFSVPRLVNHDRNQDEEFQSLDRIHYYLLGGVVFNLSENLKFKPSSMIKYTNASSLSTDITAMFLLFEKLWLGSSVRYNGDQQDVGFIVDVQVTRQFRIGYAYELPVGDIRSQTSGSHEILLIYEFKYLKSKLKSPRYF